MSRILSDSVLPFFRVSAIGLAHKCGQRKLIGAKNYSSERQRYQEAMVR